MIYLFGEDQIIEELRKFTIIRLNFDESDFERVNDLVELFNYSFSSFDILVISDQIKNNISFNRILKKLAKKIKIINVSDWYLSKILLIPPKLGKKLINQNSFNPIKNMEFFLKRLADIILSILILILSCPLLVVIAFLVHITDKGPIFYSQKRTGYLGKEIIIFKIRSMKINAEKNDPIWAAQNDSRITKIGKFIRKTRLDEIPQLISVIKGEMSLIGPRPERPSIEKDLLNNIPNYDLRHLIKPGLSGWAQVNYPYGASIEDSYMKLSFDLYYIAKFSIFLDFIIFFKTIILVSTAKGSIPNNRLNNFF